MNFSFLSHVERPKYSDTQLSFHDCYEIVYYIKGAGFTVIGGTSYRYAPNTYAIIPAYIEHEEKRLADTEIVFAGFKIIDQNKILQQGIFHDHDLSVYHIVSKMERDFTRQLPYCGRYLNLLCEQLTVFQLRKQKDDLFLHPAISDAVHYIDSHFYTPLTVESLAKKAGYSYHRFRHLFKEFTGSSPMDFILGKRLYTAKLYLMHTDKTIAQIREACGFQSPEQFSRLFKDFAGMSPRDYRKFKEWKENVYLDSEEEKS